MGGSWKMHLYELSDQDAQRLQNIQQEEVEAVRRHYGAVDRGQGTFGTVFVGVKTSKGSMITAVGRIVPTESWRRGAMTKIGAIGRSVFRKLGTATNNYSVCRTAVSAGCQPATMPLLTHGG